jgi:hypothetical protein
MLVKTDIGKAGVSSTLAQLTSCREGLDSPVMDHLSA